MGTQVIDEPVSIKRLNICLDEPNLTFITNNKFVIIFISPDDEFSLFFFFNTNFLEKLGFFFRIFCMMYSGISVSGLKSGYFGMFERFIFVIGNSIKEYTFDNIINKTIIDDKLYNFVLFFVNLIFL